MSTESQAGAPVQGDAAVAAALGRWFARLGVRLAASVLTGVLTAACFPLYRLHVLVWIALLPLLLALLHEERLKRAYALGALAAAVFLAGSVYWFAGVMENYGHISAPAALGVVVIFLIVDSSYWGALAVLICWTARRSRFLALGLAAPLWVAMEFAQTYGYFNGFPWNLLGYGVQADGLRQLARWTGVYGLSFLAVATAALISALLVADTARARRFAAGALVLWVFACTGWDTRVGPPLPPGKEIAVLVQPNVPLNESADAWAPWLNPGPLRHLVDMSLAKLAQNPPNPGTTSPPLIVWSENGAPFYFDRDPVFRTTIEAMARQAGAYVIAGETEFVGGDTRKPLNTALVLDPSGNVILRYAKIHLVPFGEYVPAWLDHLVGKITIEAGNFVPGSNYSSARLGSAQAGVFICYEEIFPALVRRLTPRGPSVLVNISDDAWYGDSSASYQTMEMARLRAIENGRYLLRATNDGVTDVIDPFGRVQATLPRHVQDTLAVRFEYLDGETFYHAHGDLFAWLCLAAALAIVVAGRVTRR